MSRESRKKQRKARNRARLAELLLPNPAPHGPRVAMRWVVRRGDRVALAWRAVWIPDHAADTEVVH